jgi:IrrE N-terminal-like domain
MSTTLERGFKSWAERTSAGIREELGLSSLDRLVPGKLASYLNVLLWTPRDVPNLPASVVAQLLVHDPSGWSAVTVMLGTTAVVIHNPTHLPGRQSSNIIHELAHIILSHQPAQLIMSQDGSLVMRSYDEKQEEEANCLGWSLLLPREGLLTCRRRGMTATDIAQRYQVSENLASFRLNTTGVEAQFKAASRFRRR